MASSAIDGLWNGISVVQALVRRQYVLWMKCLWHHSSHRRCSVWCPWPQLHPTGTLWGAAVVFENTASMPETQEISARGCYEESLGFCVPGSMGPRLRRGQEKVLTPVSSAPACFAIWMCKRQSLSELSNYQCAACRCCLFVTCYVSRKATVMLQGLVEPLVGQWHMHQVSQ